MCLDTWADIYAKLLGRKRMDWNGGVISTEFYYFFNSWSQRGPHLGSCTLLQLSSSYWWPEGAISLQGWLCSYQKAKLDVEGQAEKLMLPHWHAIHVTVWPGAEPPLPSKKHHLGTQTCSLKWRQQSTFKYFCYKVCANLRYLSFSSKLSTVRLYRSCPNRRERHDGISPQSALN